jgi:hypothetical protein
MLSRVHFLVVAIVTLVLGSVILIDLFVLYAPFQTAVAVVAPFLVVTALLSIGVSALLMAAGASSQDSLEPE